MASSLLNNNEEVGYGSTLGSTLSPEPNVYQKALQNLIKLPQSKTR